MRNIFQFHFRDEKQKKVITQMTVQIKHAAGLLDFTQNICFLYVIVERLFILFKQYR